MAAFRTIVARTGCTEQMIAHLAPAVGFVGVDGQWIGKIAEDEAAAVIAANEKFWDDAICTDWVVSPNSTDVWEITGDDHETVIGWSADAGGWPFDPTDGAPGW